MKRLLSFSALFLLVINLFSQGILISPINSRVWTAEAEQDVIALGITDTLKLPFFEDFVGNTNGQPDSKLWIDRDIWISNGFTNESINSFTAVFDHLDEKGKPYGAINQNRSIFADSLTSQPINLSSLNASNNILLSFFWAAGGLGDAPEIEDSLKLYFKNDTGAWIQQWSVGGNNAKQKMEHAGVFVTGTRFFHNAFQFRFVNYTKETGNLNHFLLDYLAMEQGRLADSSYKGYKDMGITRSSGSLLKDYSEMPYTHFKTNPNGLVDAEHCIFVRNIEQNTIGQQARFGLNYYNQYGTKIGSIVPNSQGRNIPADSFGSNCFPMPKLDTLSGNNPIFRIDYSVFSLGGNEFPVNYNQGFENDSFSYTQKFNPWYAYDDGSAEGGIGLDYTSLPANHKGQFAIKFNNKLADSLKGVAIYFNRSKEDVSFRSFKLKVWEELSAVNQPDNNDKLLYAIDVSKPAYTDSINGFAYIMFDSAIALPSGDFYVGWEQSQKYLLNVGYDNNYRFENQERFNPNVFSNLLNSWKKGFDIYGTPMIRPIIGQDKDFYFGTESIALKDIVLYPNPAQNKLTIANLPENSLLKVMSIAGRVVFETTAPTFDVSQLKSGMYLIQIEHMNAIRLVRFIKE